jgi:MoxR-like ATPase
MQALILAGKIAALLEGREAVALEDVRAVARPALRHRLILNYEAQAEGIDPDAVVGEVLAALPTK